MFTIKVFLFKFDLMSGYHHIGIYKPHQKLNTILHGKLRMFGLGTTCYVFTKLMQPLVRYWRGRGLCTVLYLNDGIVAVSGKESAECENNKSS